MDGLPRENIEMAATLTIMIISQLRALYSVDFERDLSSSPQSFDMIDIFHYKDHDKYGVVAVGYGPDHPFDHKILLRSMPVTGGVMDALEALWTYTQELLTEKMRMAPICFRGGALQ